MGNVHREKVPKIEARHPSLFYFRLMLFEAVGQEQRSNIYFSRDLHEVGSMLISSICVHACICVLVHDAGFSLINNNVLLK